MTDTPRYDSLLDSARREPLSFEIGAVWDALQGAEKELAAERKAKERAISERGALSEDAERLDWIALNVSAIRDIGWIGHTMPLRATIDKARGGGEQIQTQSLLAFIAACLRKIETKQP